MKLVIGFLRWSTLIALFFWVPSCRSLDADSSPVGYGLASVKINLLGSEFSNSGLASQQASLKKTEGAYTNIEVENHRVLIDPSTMLITELSTASSSLKMVAQGSSNKIASVSGDPLISGFKFRIIAYKPDGTYELYQDYTVGEAAIPLKLVGGTTYTLVAYSFGGSLPAITTGEQTNLNNAQVDYQDNNRDFMYWAQSYTPQTTDEVLNIILSHKVAQITTTIKTTAFTNSEMTSIQNAKIMPHSSQGKFNLSNGNITDLTMNPNGALVTFNSQNSGPSLTAAPVFVNANTGGNNTASLTAGITFVDNTTHIINLPNAFKITPGYKNNLTINLKKCGAYIDSNVWKEFMCHNLGADTSKDPFTPDASIHGDKYQWGKKTPALTQAADQDASHDQAVVGWDTTPAPDGDWAQAKGPQDPCPNDYRVPTDSEWEGLFLKNYNLLTRIGSWNNGSTNYSSGVKVGDFLFLPSAGKRLPNVGALDERGFSGHYWSVNTTGGYAGNIYFTDPQASIALHEKWNGFSVRCIKQ
nr:hypothetical protein [Elizabethkingia sp. ASV34]